jgi:hypothetical protein
MADNKTNPNRARFRFGRSYLFVIMVTLLSGCLQKPAQAAGNRSTYIPYDISWFGPPDFEPLPLIKSISSSIPLPADAPPSQPQGSHLHPS